MLIIPVDGACLLTGHQRVPSLHVLRAGVGDGPIEAVPYFDRIRIGDVTHACAVLCHERGKLIGLSYNRRATAHWYAAAPQMIGRDVLVGDIVVLYGNPSFMRAI